MNEAKKSGQIIDAQGRLGAGDKLSDLIGQESVYVYRWVPDYADPVIRPGDYLLLDPESGRHYGGPRGKRLTARMPAHVLEYRQGNEFVYRGEKPKRAYEEKDVKLYKKQSVYKSYRSLLTPANVKQASGGEFIQSADTWYLLDPPNVLKATGALPRANTPPTIKLIEVAAHQQGVGTDVLRTVLENFTRLGARAFLAAPATAAGARLLATAVRTGLVRLEGRVENDGVEYTRYAIGDIKQAAGYVYHATQKYALADIASQGLLPHKPWEHTDQDSWPDGTTGKRVYFGTSEAIAAAFHPEHGPPVMLRAQTTAIPGLKRESGTGDMVTNKTVPASSLEVRTEDGWVPLQEFMQRQAYLSPDRTPGETAGVFIPIPASLATQWPKDGRKGEDESPPHFTVLYLGGPIPPTRKQELIDLVQRVADKHDPLEIELAKGVDFFENHKGQQIAHKSVTAETLEALEALHSALKHAALEAGFEVKHKEPFIAHATLAYLADKNYEGPIPEGTFMVDTLEVWGWPSDDRVLLGDGERWSVTASLRAAAVNIVDESESRDPHGKQKPQSPLRWHEYPESTHPAGDGIQDPNAGEDVKHTAVGENLVDLTERQTNVPTPLSLETEWADTYHSQNQYESPVRVTAADLLPGGAADSILDENFDTLTLQDGIQHELEHTDNKDLAKEIAKDHLVEDPDYYKKLKQVEAAFVQTTVVVTVSRTGPKYP